MVQPQQPTNSEWSDAPTVPIRPDRYDGDAPTWPGARRPPAQARPPQPRQVLSDTRPPPVPVPPPRQSWFIQNGPAIIRLVFTVIEILIAIRVVLKLLAANPAAEFTALIYALTDIFVAPFQGVFPSPGGYGSVLELSSLLAIPIYILLARLCVGIVRIMRDKRPKTRP